MTADALHPLLSSRWSPTTFDTRRSVCRWAPSAGDSQPWAFVVGRRGDSNHFDVASGRRGLTTCSIRTVDRVDIGRWRSRLPVTRPSDGELVGWTVSENYDETRVDAVNPVGHLVSDDLPVDAAADVLIRQGLSSLSSPCWGRAPVPIRSDTDLTRPQRSWPWRRFTLVQLDDTRVWIRPSYPSWEERRIELPLFLPIDDVLVIEPPDDRE